MTTLYERATSPVSVAEPPAPQRRGRAVRAGLAIRRWFGRAYKIIIPVFVGVLILLVTFVAHAVQSVDVKDPNYLNPTSSAPLGSGTLADALTDKGIVIDRETSDVAAFGAVQQPGPPATLFVPALELIRPSLAAALRALPRGTRIVLVAPGAAALSVTEAPVNVVNVRWAPVTTGPGCGMNEARQAGAAAADGVEYFSTAATVSCYDGGLIDIPDRFAGVDEVVIGASDPFRNDRIHEAGNETLAVALLSTRGRVVWLDTHTNPPLPAGPQSFDGDGGGDDPPPPSIALKPLSDLLPPWVWAGIGLLLLAGLTLSLAAGRRLGGPVAEPLPVSARITETVEGRGRLYRRTADRRAVLGILQAAAIERIRLAVGLSADATAADIVAATSAYLAIPEHEVDRILYRAEPDNDDELMFAVASLDAITEFADPHAVSGAVNEGES